MFWKFGERISAQLVSTLVSIILARLLIPEDYGVIALVTVFITICNVFVVNGFGTALVQKKDADDLDFTSVFYFSIFLAVLLYAVIFVCAPFIAKFYDNEVLTPIVRVMGIRIIIAAINSVQHAYLDRRMQFKKFFISTIFGTVISGVVGVWLAYNGYGVWALVAQYLTNVTIDTCVLAFVIKWIPKFNVSFARLKGLFSFGWKILASSLLDTGYNELRTLIIGKKYDSESLAYYNKGGSFPSLISNNVNTAVNSVLLTALSKIQSEKERVKQSMKKSLQVCAFVILPCMVGFAAIGSTFISVVLTDKWLPSLPYLYITCATFTLYPIHNANLTAMQAMGRSDLFLKLEIVKKVVGIASILVSMWFGVFWMAMSALFSGIICSFINAFPNKKLLNYGYFEQIKDILPCVLCSLFMGIPVFFMNYLPINKVLLLVMQVAVGVGLYVLINIITGNKIYFDVLKLVKNFFGKYKTAQTVEDIDDRSYNALVKNGKIYSDLPKEFATQKDYADSLKESCLVKYLKLGKKTAGAVFYTVEETTVVIKEALFLEEYLSNGNVRTIIEMIANEVSNASRLEFENGLGDFNSEELKTEFEKNKSEQCEAAVVKDSETPD